MDFSARRFSEVKVREMIAAGKSLDEIKATFGIAAPAAGAQASRRRPSVVEIIDQELTEKK